MSDHCKLILDAASASDFGLLCVDHVAAVMRRLDFQKVARIMKLLSEVRSRGSKFFLRKQ